MPVPVHPIVVSVTDLTEFVLLFLLRLFLGLAALYVEIRAVEVEEGAEEEEMDEAAVQTEEEAKEEE